MMAYFYRHKETNNLIIMQRAARVKLDELDYIGVSFVATPIVYPLTLSNGALIRREAFNDIIEDFEKDES